MTPIDYFYIWIGGAAFWCFFMSAQGEQVDFAYVLSALIWPIMALHVLGRFIAGKGLR